MSFIPAVIGILRDATAVESLVSHRIYADQAPQGVPLPHIVLEDISLEPENAVSGERAVTFAIMNVHGYSTDSAEIRDIQAAVRAALQDYYGSAGDIEILTCWVVESEIETEPPRDGSELATKHMTTTINIWR